MDPIAHTLTGATLAVTGLRRKTPLATATLLIGVNAPDVDVVAYFGAAFESLALRRGVTHGLPALVLWPFAIAALVLAWDRCVRRRAWPDAPPARAGPVLGLAALAVLTHPALDWLNNYGMRWLMPFDGTWFYGDALVVIDPWLWLALGAVPFLVYSLRRATLAAWSALWLSMSLLVLMAPGVPTAARVLWLAAIATLYALRTRPTPRSRRSDLPVAKSSDLPVAKSDLPAAMSSNLPIAKSSDRLPFEIAARFTLGLAAAYVCTMALLDLVERNLARTELTNLGVATVEHVMIAPTAANPFAGEVVVATPDEYRLGEWDWLAEPKLTLVGEPIERNDSDPIYRAAAATAEARRFLTWARFPFALVETDARGHTVSFLDARYYVAGRLFGPLVRLDRDLRPVARE